MADLRAATSATRVMIVVLAITTGCSPAPAIAPTASPARTGSATPAALASPPIAGSSSPGASEAPPSIASPVPAVSPRPMPSGPPTGAEAPIDDASWALADRLRSGTYTQDTTDAGIEALARAGIGTFAGTASVEPMVPLGSVASPLRLLDWQTHALAVQSWAGAAFRGHELDDAMTLPSAMQDGRPLASQSLAGYVASVDSPGAAMSRALMAGQDLLDTASLRIPALVLVFFVSDLATDGGTVAAPQSTGPLLARTVALGSICSDAANWVTNAIHGLFAAIKLATPENLPGKILVSIWNWLVDKAEAFVNRLIGALTDAVLAQVRFIAGGITSLVQRVASFLPYAVSVATEPQQIFVLPPSGPSPSGVFVATVTAGDLPDWPDVLKDCAGVAQVPLPDFRAAGAPVEWGPLHGDGMQFIYPLIPGSATDAIGVVRWSFGTYPDGAPGGEAVEAVMQQDVKVHRPEVAAAREALTGSLLGGLPALISDLVGRLFAPFLDAANSRLDALLDARGIAAAIIVYHKPPEPSPIPPPVSRAVAWHLESVLHVTTDTLTVTDAYSCSGLEGPWEGIVHSTHPPAGQGDPASDLRHPVTWTFGRDGLATVAIAPHTDTIFGVRHTIQYRVTLMLMKTPEPRIVVTHLIGQEDGGAFISLDGQFDAIGVPTPVTAEMGGSCP